MSDFLSKDVVTAILEHMNADHNNDNVTIVRANGAPEAETAEMTGFDQHAGYWTALTPSGSQAITVPWPSTLTDRASVRMGIVAVYDAALETLGLPARERH